jgi:uncharacterized protein (DUF4415 family)
LRTPIGRAELESFQLEKQNIKREVRIMNISKKRLKGLKAIKDSAIDTTDVPELNARFWRSAKLELPRAKKAISIRLDPDVLDWFKSQGKGYQSIMNAVLRSFVEARKGRS